jgi:two-component system heavy metal sensor histidine kinase CusS
MERRGSDPDGPGNADRAQAGRSLDDSARDELDRLAQTINGPLDRIAAYLQERRDFLANAAHELRTPLAAIHSSVEVALNNNRSREEYENLLVEIIDQGACLEKLVNQLLLISETEMDAERLKSEFTFVPLDEVVARSVAMFRGVAESHDVSLEAHIHSNVHVFGSRHLLRQMVNNLIDNAVKYTPAGGHVWVDLVVRQAEHNAGVRLCVADNGPGIAPSDVARVFERFYRADKSRSRMHETDGTGLGLSMCQAVVYAHAGTIACQSGLGEGTRMDVWLPLTHMPVHNARWRAL